MSRPFRFGVQLRPHTSRRKWIDMCRRVEDLGYDVVTVPDHIGPAGGVWAALAVAASVTERLRVGTLVLNNDYWNPAVLAREAATTDLLTGGRLELGIGAGWQRSDYEATGVVMGSAAIRIERLGETVRILRAGFDGKAVHFAGEHYQISSDAPWCAPVQSPLPILIGGGGRRILTLAGREANIVSINRNLRAGSVAAPDAELASQQGLFQQGLRDKLSWVANAAADRSAQPELHTFVLRAVVSDTRQRSAADVGRAYGIGAADALASPHFLIGTPEQIAADLLERREQWGISYYSIREDGLTHLAPVVAALIGR
jgi:probable F420-dependent oxidoreductase